MSKFLKIFAIVVLFGAALAFVPGPAQARWSHGWHHGWHRGWGWGPAVGFGLGLGLAYPYGGIYGSPYYAAAPSCGWVSVPRWWHHRRVWSQVWRCW